LSHENFVIIFLKKETSERHACIFLVHGGVSFEKTKGAYEVVPPLAGISQGIWEKKRLYVLSLKIAASKQHYVWANVKLIFFRD